MINRKPIIGVMGSHSKAWEELAAPIGRLIAEHDYHLLTGAGGGVMSAVAQAFTAVESREGVSLGVVPIADYDGSLVAREKYPNPYIELPIITPLGAKAQGDTNPFSRNHVNVMTANALIILPGDHGTQTEAALAIKYNKPMVLFGEDEQFKNFPDQPTRVQDIEEVKHFLEGISEKFRKEMNDYE